MIAGNHLIWMVYGSWLPNDPRGSSSHEVRVERIAELGELHHRRKTIQPYPAELRAFYARARQVLKHELLLFSDEEMNLIGATFDEAIRERGYTCYACAILPEHVHLLIRRHRDRAKEMIAALQLASREALVEASARTPDHPVWGGPGWKVFLNTRKDMERIVRYVRNNPLKSGRPAQEWGFVKEYDGWLPFRW